MFFPDVLSGVVTILIRCCFFSYSFITCGVFILDTCSLHRYAQELVLSNSHGCVLLVRRYLTASRAFALGDPDTRCNEQVSVRKYSGASLQQPTCYTPSAGRTSLSCWSPHTEISPLKGICVCDLFINIYSCIYSPFVPSYFRTRAGFQNQRSYWGMRVMSCPSIPSSPPRTESRAA